MNPEFAVFVKNYLISARELWNKEEDAAAAAAKSKSSMFAQKTTTDQGGKNVLDDPDLLECDDHWDEERIMIAKERVKEQGGNVSEFWRNKYRNEAASYWDCFYKRNTDNFYKDRHYLHHEWPELLGNPLENKTHLNLYEIGSGVGNAVLPLLELNDSLRVSAMDFSANAIAIINKHPYIQEYPGRLYANVCNVIRDEIPALPENAKADLVLCMFVLSAISPEHQLGVLQKLADSLEPGGRLLFRDYGRYDEAMLRFKKGSKIEENLYVRNDGTMAYYFELEAFCDMCTQVGLQPVEGRCNYVQRQMQNRQQKKARYRVWIQGVFERKMCK